MIELTQKQKEGLTLALERYKRKEKYIVIAGYAGTRKKYFSTAYYKSICR